MFQQLSCKYWIWLLKDELTSTRKVIRLNTFCSVNSFSLTTRQVEYSKNDRLKPRDMYDLTPLNKKDHARVLDEGSNTELH